MAATINNISNSTPIPTPTPTALIVSFDPLPTPPVPEVGGVECGTSVLGRSTTDGPIVGDGNSTVGIVGFAAMLVAGKASCVDEGGSKEGVIVVAVPMIEELGRTTGTELTPSTSIGSDELGTTATGEAGSELLMMTMLG